jgi:mitochondrial import inner membrane translocase subunit TIM10
MSSPTPVQMALVEMKGLADTFSRMSETCYKKCIPSVKEAALAMGEISCVDRCVNKYLDVHALIGTQLQSFQQ